ncbi:MAG: hypothetical protein ACFB13_09965 [Kiloniellaceae bacterium]
MEALARRYVDLWQDQMTSLAADPDFAESLQKVMTAMGVAASGLPAMWTAWPAAMTAVMAAAQPNFGPNGGPDLEKAQESHGEPSGGARYGDGQAGARGSTKSPGTKIGPAPAAAAPDGGGPGLGGLEERLAALEQRLLSLEGALEGGPGRARGKTAKRAGAKSKRG